LQYSPRLGPAEDAPEQWVTMHEIFDHTADLGLRVQAETYEALCSEAAQGLAEVIAGNIATIQPTVSETLFVVGTDSAWLLVDLLAELLAAFELRRMLFVDYRVSRTEMGLRADCRGERFDPKGGKVSVGAGGICLRPGDGECGPEAAGGQRERHPAGQPSHLRGHDPDGAPC